MLKKMLGISKRIEHQMSTHKDFASGDKLISTSTREYRGGVHRKILLWFLFVSIVPMILIGSLSYGVAKKSMRQSSVEMLVRSAHSRSAFINNWFSYRIRDIESQASKKDAVEFLSRLNEEYQSSENDLAAFVKGYQWNKLVHEFGEDYQNFQRTYGYYDVVLIDLDGNILYSNTQEEDLGKNLLTGSLAETKFAHSFRQTVETGQTVFSDIEKYEPSGFDPAGFLTTIIIDSNGDKIGVLAFQISANQLRFTMHRLDQEGQDIVTYIIGISDTFEGASLRASLHGWLEGSNAIAGILNKPVRNPQADLWYMEHGDLTDNLMAESSEQVMSYRSEIISNDTVLGIHQDIEIAGVHWGVVAELPEDIAFASIANLKRIMIGLGVITGMLVILVASSVTSRITRPIRNLSEVALRVASGDLDHTCSVESNDEFGLLGHSFNQMISSLNELFSELQFQKYALDQHSIVTITDIHGDITYVNEKFVEISGYSREELLGNNHRMIQSGEHSREFFCTMWKTIASKKVWTGEVKNRAKDGSTYWVHATVVPLVNKANRITHYVAIRTDITVMKNSESMLQEAHDSLMSQRNELVSMTDELCLSREFAEQANKSKSEFLANMSHEIRTPMTAILGFAETLRDDTGDDLGVMGREDAVNTILRNGEHLLTIINDILDISKIEAGKMVMEEIPCSPFELVSDVHSLMKVRSDSKGLSLDMEFEGLMPEQIVSDPTRVRQILVNIVGNAIKFTEQGGVKVVTRYVTNPSGTYSILQFDVIDTGIGLTEEQVGMLFQAFAQADSSTTREFGGTGLGLDISKRFAEMLGGTITIRSVKGEGSTFRVTINPQSFDGAKLISASDAFASSKVAKENDKKYQENVSPLDCRVLLAEDGKDNQRLISFMLRKAGAHVELAENGQVALEAALRAKADGMAFDVILMDMQMPILSGYEATAALRECDYDGSIIALTAHAMDSDRQKCIDSGCDDFVTKPINRPKLIELIRFYSNRPASAA